MGDLPRLQSLLGRLVAMHRLAPGAENVWLTEQGYESNAQLPDRPWTEAEQASLNAASEYLAWRDPHAASFSQFLLRDTLTRETLALRARTGHPHALVVGTWTTGLVRENYTAKPALSMFRSPVLARTVGPVWPAPPFSAADLAPPMPGPTQYVEIWGRARPAAGGTVAQIQIASRPGVFETVATVVTDRNGIFDLTLPAAGDTQPEVRFRWIDVSGAWQTSPAAAPLTFPLPGQPEASAGMSLRLLG
jgi:hypothetical protein